MPNRKPSRAADKLRPLVGDEDLFPHSPDLDEDPGPFDPDCDMGSYTDFGDS